MQQQHLHSNLPTAPTRAERDVERLRAQKAEQREKNQITVVSVLAAIGLTTFKLIVGVLTGSLGLLAEAAHSGLDAFATILTFFSVRIAGRPADANHPYGHGRFENLSATIQGLLLLGISAFIIFESIRRVFFVAVGVEPSAWAFIVMGGSIATDLWRSTLLLRAARKYHSRALEADALNFRADMFSASVVIVGLALTTYAELTGTAPWLANADAVAALVVACVIIYMSGKLALGAINTLLDHAPEDLALRMNRAVAETPGVLRAEAVRLRESGSRLFADVTVGVPRTSSLEQAHAISERVETAVRAVEARTETVVHIEPEAAADESACERIRAVAQRLGWQTHHEQLSIVGDGRAGGTGTLE
ncbi:MAG: cation transporter, partial [Ktedonobacterales bacterium]|nr:cation transporter [Ktedonobacterales bacterium]